MVKWIRISLCDRCIAVAISGNLTDFSRHSKRVSGSKDIVFSYILQKPYEFLDMHISDSSFNASLSNISYENVEKCRSIQTLL